MPVEAWVCIVPLIFIGWLMWVRLRAGGAPRGKALGATIITVLLGAFVFVGIAVAGQGWERKDALLGFGFVLTVGAFLGFRYWLRKTLKRFPLLPLG